MKKEVIKPMVQGVVIGAIVVGDCNVLDRLGSDKWCCRSQC